MAADLIESMSAMLEKVARALFEHHQDGPFPPEYENIILYGQPRVTWDFVRAPPFLRDDEKNIYFQKARAALQALKQLDDETAGAMVHAAGSYDMRNDECRSVFIAAIDHILKGGE